jgi:hypothetical protein
MNSESGLSIRKPTPVLKKSIKVNVKDVARKGCRADYSRLCARGASESRAFQPSGNHISMDAETKQAFRTTMITNESRQDISGQNISLGTCCPKIK